MGTDSMVILLPDSHAPRRRGLAVVGIVLAGSLGISVAAADSTLTVRSTLARNSVLPHRIHWLEDHEPAGVEGPRSRLSVDGKLALGRTSPTLQLRVRRQLSRD